MPKGVLGLSTALDGSFTYPCLPPPSLGLTFSADFCLFRENVEMDSAGREDGARALVEESFFSGEIEAARLAEGVLLCEDVRDVLEVLPLESLVRRLALRERCNCEPKSPMVDEMLCREACLRRGGVVCTLDGNSYWLGTRGGGSPSRGRLMVGAVVVRRSGGTAVGVLGVLCFPPPKKEGRREKMLDWAWVWAEEVSVVVEVESASAMVVPVRSRFLETARIRGWGWDGTAASDGLMADRPAAHLPRDWICVLCAGNAVYAKRNNR